MTKVDVHFDNIKDQILTLINNAENDIKICMAWFTDKNLMNKLLEKLDQGLNVEICMLDDKFNRIKLPKEYGSKLENLKNYWADLKSFQDKHGKLNIVPKHLGFIHHKFAVIDNKTTVTGSYNWSVNASKNKENIVIIEDVTIAEKYISQLKEIISINHNDIIENNFSSCENSNCQGKILKVKLIDFRSTTKYFQNDTYTIGICTQDMEHITTLSDNLETDYIGDLIENEFQQIEGQLEGKSLKHKEALINRRIKSEIAWSLNSRLDILIDNNSHDLLGFYKITSDMDGDYELRTIWEHELIKQYYIKSWENEIIEFVDDY